MQPTPVDQPVPQSRPSLSTREAPQQGPIPLFDYHLTILTDSYLGFFQERKRIEENYVESLLNLHRKAKTVDALFDDRNEMSTTRSAWFEVRDNIDREAQTRQAFLNTLTIDVVNILTALKDTQDRTRKRIKEDLKESSIAYNDYAENALPKLKRTYLRKCQDVEDHKAAAQTQTPHPPRHDSGPQQQQHSPEYHNAPLTNSRSNPSLPTKPVVTSPHPLRPLDRRPSGSLPSARNRSPSTNTAFSDLASHGKGKFNQLITFLDKTGNVKDSLGGRSDGSALRAVRSKREAEEADKEYRKGIHWLETLRLRRTKILEAGYTSLERFVYESATTIKQVLEQYTDNMTATTTTQTHLSTHVRSIVDRISPSKDMHALTQAIPRSLASAIPKPILYWNYNVGECSDLIFGVSLVDYTTARGLVEGEVPKIVRICTKEIDSRGLESEGIYRAPGRHAIVQELQHKIERNEAAFEFNPQTDDVFAVSSLLKLYLRELPEPVFRYPLQDRIQHTEDRADHQSNNFVLLRSKVRRLPPVHQATLKAILEHLARVAAMSEKNKMDVKNLAIAFGGVIFGEDELPKGGDLLSMQSWKDTLMEDLITNAAVLFDDRAPAATSPPLPPAPLGQPTPNYAYGSAHTKVASVPAPIHMPARQQAQLQSPEDFTPRLPSRPANSIHPSSRANPTSPTKTNMDVPPALPARPGQASPSKYIASEKPPPLTPKSTMPLPTENTPPSPSATSTLVATQEEGERASASEEHRDNMSVQDPTPPSPIQTSKSLRTPMSIASSLPSESAQAGGSGPNTSPTGPSVPGGFPS